MTQDGPRTPFTDLPRFGSGPGLHRMLWLRDALGVGDWLAGLDAVKVTGSNGKGSVCAMVSSIFARLGVSHGLYISPHLVDFRERIRVDGEMISAADLEQGVARTRRLLADYAVRHPGDQVAAFEATTALALDYFARRGARTVVAEAGIGGRFDTTRVVPGSIAALTTVDLEHTEILGSSRELIAYDKADLCPAGGRLIVGRLGRGLLRRLHAYAELRGIEMTAIEERCRVLATSFDGGRTIADVEIAGRRWSELEIALAGDHQVDNAMVAVLVAEAWTSRHLPGLGAEAFEDAVREGLRRVEWPGRFQKIATDPDVFIDVGHTPAAARCVVEAARRLAGAPPILLVTGTSDDKNAKTIVSTLVEMASSVICTRAAHKGADVGRIEAAVASTAPQLPCRRAETVVEAVEAARQEARSAGMTVVVAGGLYLALEATEAWQGRDPSALRFS